MARKLKTYTTSAGFFDLAVAAPSMKAALAAWGSNSNLFQHGFAKVSEDPQIVAATMARPGVVLRRPVGTDARFSEDARLPKDLLAGKLERKPAKRKPPKEEPPPPAAVDDKATRAAAARAAAAFEKEEKRREAQRRREEAAREKERERRDEAVAAAEAALEKARHDHEQRMGEIEKDRAALDRRADAEDARWRKKKEQLEEALRQARSPSHLRLV